MNNISQKINIRPLCFLLILKMLFFVLFVFFAKYYDKMEGRNQYSESFFIIVIIFILDISSICISVYKKQYIYVIIVLFFTSTISVLYGVEQLNFYQIIINFLDFIFLILFLKYNKIK